MNTYAIAATAVLLSACAATVAAPPAPVPAAAPAEVKELVRKDLKLGEGRSAEKENAVLVHYTGWLYDPKAPDMKGAKFDASEGRAAPFGFMIGRGRVIKARRQRRRDQHTRVPGRKRCDPRNVPV